MTPTRLVRCLLMLVLVTGAGSWAGALRLLDEPRAAGRPGEYVTLPFRLVGEGTYGYEVRTDTGWTPLANTGTVRLDGDGYMSVTLRVPRTAVAGTRSFVEVVFTNRDDPQDVVHLSGVVLVETLTEIALVVPERIEAELGRAFSFPIVVTNAGNQTDRITLHAERPMWDVRFSENEVEVDPGASYEVMAEVSTDGEVFAGYRLLLAVESTSRNDPSVTAEAFVRVTFQDAASRTLAATTDQAPRLALALASGVNAGVSLHGGVADADVGFSITPGLSGSLSDYVDVGLGVGSFRGSIEDPFEEVPSRLDVALTAASWDASASIGPGRYGLAAGTVVGDWRVSGGADLAPKESGTTFGVSAFASSLAPELDLQFSGRSASVNGSGRRDAIGARYRTPLSEGLVLGTGLDIIGSVGEDPYQVDVGVHQNLSYQTQAFDVTQSYSGLPLAGLHNLGLSGGLRGTAPFGVRASTALQFAPDTISWRSAVTVGVTPVPALRTSVTGLYRTSATTTGDEDATFGVQANLSYRFGNGPVRGGFGVGYTYTGVLRGNALPTSTAFARLSGSVAGLEVALGGSYLTAHGGQAADPEEDGVAEAWEAGGTASYAAGRAATLRFEAGYAWERGLGASAPTVESTSLEASWTQAWSDEVRSEFSYTRLVDVVALDVNRSERVQLSVQVSGLGIDGLAASSGYALSTDTGLLTGLTPLRHEFRVRLGYTLVLPFATPAAVVDTFGGRRGGEVSGVAFVDRDLDGERDASEPGIAGMTLALGGVQTITDDDGKYRLRVPSGTYRWFVVRGAPASTEATVASTIDIEDDSEQVLDQPFVPVVPLNVTLFDDADNDGARAATEGGIAFGGVIVDGPVRKMVRVDGRGNALVTGLVPGAYRVAPNPAALPARYHVTTDAVLVVLSEGQRPAPVVVGAGAPPREVVTTFASGSLAVFAKTNRAQVPAGAEVRVDALVGGAAERVTLLLGAEAIPMMQGSTGWSATVRIPSGTQPGPLAMQVRAEGGGAEAVGSTRVDVTDDAPFRLEPTRIRPGRDVPLRLETLFAASSAELRVGDVSLALVSEDGYRWTYLWEAESVPEGVFEGEVVVDGVVIGRVRVEPLPPND